MSNRKSIKDYPSSYTDIVNHFKVGGEEIYFLLPAVEAHSTRRNLYRFFAEIRRSEDEGDSYAAEFAEITRNLIVSITGSTKEKLRLTVKRSTKLDFGKAGDLSELDKNLIAEAHEKNKFAEEKNKVAERFEIEDALKELTPTNGLEDLLQEMESAGSNYLKDETKGE